MDVLVGLVFGEVLVAEVLLPQLDRNEQLFLQISQTLLRRKYSVTLVNVLHCVLVDSVDHEGRHCH